MLNKLVLRNARRLWKDYLTYFLTLCIVAAFMLAFHSLLFSKDIYDMVHFGNSGEISTAGTMLITFIVISTVLIMVIVAWLINYMAHFIMEKRSREFAVYLLVGMKRKQIASLYIKENLLLGMAALFLGMILGGALQQALFFFFYKSIGKQYKINFVIPIESIFLTMLLYGLCLCFALMKNRKKFSHMKIIRLINMDKQNEEVNEKKCSVFQWFLVLSIGNILLLYLLLFSGHITKAGAILEMAGLVFTFYFFYLGLASFLMMRLKHAPGECKFFYRKDHLFLIRQFSSKIKNTCFTLGTLSLLFTFALLGSSLAFMMSDYQNKQLNVEYPFDIIIISDNTEADFAKEEKEIERTVPIKDKLIYSVYENGTSDVRDFLYQHLKTFSGDDVEMMEVKRNIAYYENDVYMGLTDYNYLRKMLGYAPVSMQDNQYLIHMPNRVYRELINEGLDICLQVDGHDGKLDFYGYRTEGFAQAGHNGADFLIVVPDDFPEQMHPYFSLMAVMAKEEVPEELCERLYQLNGKVRGYDEINDYIKIGSEDMFLTPASIQVKSREVAELKFLMSTLSFPLFYIGLVFLCVSLTVLSVQQVSDAAKYKFRYQILHQIGMRKKRIRFLVMKQLFFYYLCPVILAVLISAVMILYIGRQFVRHTGIDTAWSLYFMLSLAGFFGIYALYFGVTYFQFVRNVDFI